MIQVNELRIGNCVMIKRSNDKGIYRVKNIGGFQRIFDSKEDEILFNSSIEKQIKSKKTAQFHDEMLVGISGLNRDGERIIESKLKPIKLTEELLLKCGFKEIKNEPRKWFKIKTKKRGVSLDICFSSKRIVLNNGYDFVDLLYIKYLHQLQNLYFALTNEELIINL